MAQEINQLVFRRRHRISGSDEFAAVFDAKLKKSSGVITVFLMATDQNEHRLGLSIGKRVGNAVVRGRLKRMIREAFRHQQADFPCPSDGQAYDIVIVGRKHDRRTLEEYSSMMMQAVLAAHRTHEKRTHEKQNGRETSWQMSEHAKPGLGLVSRIGNWPFLLVIYAYRATLSPFIGGQCRFEPTCSRYGLEAYRVYGPIRGTMMTTKRILRCNPFSKGGYDPVPIRSCSDECEADLEQDQKPDEKQDQNQESEQD